MAELGKNVAVVLAAGRGSRMRSGTPKQYIMLEGIPLVCHSLNAMEACEFIDQVVLVVGSGEKEYVRTKIVEVFAYRKLAAVVEGGAWRYESVHNALAWIMVNIPNCGHVYIHDGARPYLDQATLIRLREAVEREGACIAAVPVKDTIKIVDKEGRIEDTPDRNMLWAAQTPQVFAFHLIWDAYARMIKEGQIEGITDDAQVLERMCGIGSVVVEGSYSNIKITTPEDLPEGILA